MIIAVAKKSKIKIIAEIDRNNLADIDNDYSTESDVVLGKYVIIETKFDKKFKKNLGTKTFNTNIKLFTT